jgi:G3E family GTPase
MLCKVICVATFFALFCALTTSQSNDVRSPSLQRCVVHLLASQVETASVILINKTDLLSVTQLTRLKAHVRSLNTDARILGVSYGRTTLGTVLNTQTFLRVQLAKRRRDKAQLADGGDSGDGGGGGGGGAALDDKVVGEQKAAREKYGIASFEYTAARPFHPTRLHALMCRDLAAEFSLIRSKGFVCVASRVERLPPTAAVPSYARLYWSHAGTQTELINDVRIPYSPAEFTTAPPPTGSGDGDGDGDGDEPAVWKGDGIDPLSFVYSQSIVCIGIDMQRDAVVAAFDACLLTPAEMRSHPPGEVVAASTPTVTTPPSDVAASTVYWRVACDDSFIIEVDAEAEAAASAAARDKALAAEAASKAAAGLNGSVGVRATLTRWFNSPAVVVAAAAVVVAVVVAVGRASACTRTR